MDTIHSLFKDALGAVNPIPKIQEKWTMIRGNQNLKNCAVGHEATYEDRDKNWTKLEPFEKSIEIGNKIADLMTRDETIKSDDDATLRYLCDVGFISLLVDSPLNGLFKKSDYEEGDEIFRRLRIVGMLNTIEKTWTNKNIGEKNEKYWTTFYSKLFNVFQTIPFEVDSGQKSKEKWENPNTAFNNMVEFIQVASIYYTTLYNARPVGLFADERWINDPSAIKFRGMLNAIKQMPEEQQVIIGQKLKELDNITKTGVYGPDGNNYDSTARVLSNALIEHTN